jgi:arylsulfatase A-like enzyme
VAIALLAALPGSSACGPRTTPASGPRAGGKPSIILISIDTLRPDHLGMSGYRRDTSPFLDSLAGQGVRFVNAFAQASWTLPSHVSMLTSTHPRTHQVENASRSLAPSLPTVAELLKRQGYLTAGFVTWIYLSSEFGLGRGYDRYDELLPPPAERQAGTHQAARAGELVDRVSAWAAGVPATPYFLFLHLFDPHMNYEPPLDDARRFDPTLESTEAGSYAYLTRFISGLHPAPVPIPPAVRDRAMALYDGEIRYTDDQLKRLFHDLETAGLLANTWIVITSDHGEEFAEHGSMEGHQWTLYDEVLRVPLVVLSPPAQRTARTVARMAQSIDIAPTLLAVAGVAPPNSFEGRSLLPWILGENPTGGDEISFSQIRRFNLKWAIRTPRYKLIYTGDAGRRRGRSAARPGFEMYDLSADPGERHDLYDAAAPAARDLSSRLRAFMLGGPGEVEVPKPDLTPEEIERLRSLGYVGP